MSCTTVVLKRSPDNVSDDVAFRGPAVELLVVTMHRLAQPCHTKSESFGLKLHYDALDASAYKVVCGAAVFINFSRSYRIFPDFAETSDRFNSLFIFSPAIRLILGGLTDIMSCRSFSA